MRHSPVVQMISVHIDPKNTETRQFRIDLIDEMRSLLLLRMLPS